jgi:predicted enzyme related to lactoylglutathione lyase
MFVVSMAAWTKDGSGATPGRTNDMSDTKVIHFEIVGRDGPALQRFYGDVFGWQFDTNNPGGYGMSSPDETGIVVGIGASHDGGAGHVTGYVTVQDIDATLGRATANGGRVVMPKFSPGPGATLALVADPEGHVVGLTEL